jgi:hypothetical protein
MGQLNVGAGNADLWTERWETQGRLRRTIRPAEKQSWLAHVPSSRTGQLAFKCFLSFSPSASINSVAYLSELSITTEHNMELNIAPESYAALKANGTLRCVKRAMEARACCPRLLAKREAYKYYFHSLASSSSLQLIQLSSTDPLNAIYRPTCLTRCLFETKYTLPSRHSSVVLALAYDLVKKFMDALLAHIAQTKPGARPESTDLTADPKLNVVTLRCGMRFFICYDMFPKGCTEEVRDRVD